SGKTEVYLHAIADCLARGRQALVLVAEVGLTPRVLARVRARLGVPGHATHSGLNDGERARTWAAAWRGEARVIVGTRSAVFTPLPDAGLIVIDEEHDGSYKQQDGIRYHARDFAMVRGKTLGVPVLLGSATPSLESLHNAGGGRFGYLPPSRPGGARGGCAQARARGRPVDADARRDPRRAGRWWAGAGVPQPPRLRAGAAVPRLRLERAVPALRHRRPGPADDRARAWPAPAVPPLRPPQTLATCLPGLRQPGAAAAGRGHRAHRGSAGGEVRGRARAAHRSRQHPASRRAGAA